MKCTAIILPALLLGLLFDGRTVVQAAPQVATPAQKKAWADCQSFYRGQRFMMNKDRYGLIEGCFKQMTGMYPAQLQLNCTLRRC